MNEWIIDCSGLIIQGAIMPLLQTALGYGVLISLFPDAGGALVLPGTVAFLLNFVAVDYLYYWNHRYLHSRRLWAAHAVHHSAETFDVLITSRNTLWTPALIVYVWINSLMLYLLRDPEPYLIAASITAALDLWRHSRLWPSPRSVFHRWLSTIFITPHEHGWHHSRHRVDVNFGANLSLWDRLHGTYFSPHRSAGRYGIPLDMNLKKRLFYPF